MNTVPLVLTGERGAWPSRMRTRWRPGTLAAGLVWSTLLLFVALPLAALFARAASADADTIRATLTAPRVRAAFATTFGTALAAALADVVLALPVAWALGRYEFPGRRVVDALVDVPMALPTSVAGLTLAALTSPNGPVGRLLAPLGVRVAYTPLGVALALAFVGFPFVVRAVEPVVQALDEGVLEAARSLGASPASIAGRVVAPQLAPAALSGFGVALARSLGKYGSVIFIAGNLPFKTEVVSLFIVARIEDHEPLAAAILAVALLAASGALLAVVATVERRASRTLVPAERV
jgi:sulfate transport system permease protein